MPKITYKQSELNTLFAETVIVIDDSTRRVTKVDILQKTGLSSDFDIEVIQDVVEEIPDFEEYE